MTLVALPRYDYNNKFLIILFYNLSDCIVKYIHAFFSPFKKYQTMQKS